MSENKNPANPDLKKTKAQLIGELEATRSRLQDLEERPDGERRHNYLLRIFIDALPHFAFSFDADARILQVVTGDFSSEARVLEGKLLADIVPQVDAEELTHALRRTFESGESQHLEFIMSVMAGRRWYAVRTALVNEQPRHEPSVVFLFQDVTNEKLAEGVLKSAQMELAEKTTALAESDQRFKNVIDNSPSAIHLKDLDGRYIMVNGVFAEQRGYSAKEMIGKMADELFPAELADRITAQEQEVLNTGNAVDWEYVMPFPDGTRHIIMNTKFPVNGNDGKVIGVGTIATDISEQRKIEGQLRESQKFEAVGQLAGGIAHEFNNRLQVIINSAHFARNRIHEPQIADDFLGTILRAADSSAALAKQLLVYSRKSDLVPTVVNLNELTTNLMKMIGPIIGEEIILNLRQADELFPVNVDSAMIEQALINLCLNARDAMPDGGQLIIETRNHRADREFCELHGLRQPGDYAVISVSDSGTGMSSEIREHIFEPFFTTKEVGKGTGLGLAMVHGTIQQHDGVIETLSEPGVGTTFNIYLPKTDSQEGRNEVPTVSEIPGGRETILVAEDGEDVLKLLAQTLESRGYRVLAAKDGEEAMSVFKANMDRIDLVLLDMVMPKLSGRKVYDQIRDSGSGVPVLFSTAYSLDSLDAEFAAENELPIIQKPYAPDVLFAAVREVLDRKN